MKHHIKLFEEEKDTLYPLLPENIDIPKTMPVQWGHGNKKITWPVFVGESNLSLVEGNILALDTTITDSRFAILKEAGVEFGVGCNVTVDMENIEGEVYITKLRLNSISLKPLPLTKEE